MRSALATFTLLASYANASLHERKFTNTSSSLVSISTSSLASSLLEASSASSAVPTLPSTSVFFSSFSQSASLASSYVPSDSSFGPSPSWDASKSLSRSHSTSNTTPSTLTPTSIPSPNVTSSISNSTSLPSSSTSLLPVDTNASVSAPGICTGCVLEAYEPRTTWFNESSERSWTSVVLTQTVITEYTTWYHQSSIETVQTFEKTITQDSLLTLNGTVNPTSTYTTPVFAVTIHGFPVTLQAGSTYVIYEHLYGGLDYRFRPAPARTTTQALPATCTADVERIDFWFPSSTENWSYFIQTLTGSPTSAYTEGPLPLPSTLIDWLKQDPLIQNRFSGSNIETCTLRPTHSSKRPGGSPPITETQSAAPVFPSPTATYISTSIKTTSAHVTTHGCLRCQSEIPRPSESDDHTIYGTEIDDPEPTSNPQNSDRPYSNPHSNPPSDPPHSNPQHNPPHSNPPSNPPSNPQDNPPDSNTPHSNPPHSNPPSDPPSNPQDNPPDSNSPQSNPPHSNPPADPPSNPQDNPPDSNTPHSNPPNDPDGNESQGNPGSGYQPGQSITIGDNTYPVYPAPPTSRPDPQNPNAQNQQIRPTGVVIGSQTLAPGQTATINGVPVVVPSGDDGPKIIVDGNTIAVSPVPTSPPVLTVGDRVVTANSQGNFIIGSQTLNPGGPAITIGGSTLSLGPGGSIAIVNGVTKTLGIAPFPTGMPAITAGDQTVQATVIGGSTMFVIGQDQTLTPGGVLTVDGTTFSMPEDGAGSTVVVNGVTSTLDAPGIPVLTLDNQDVTADVEDGTTAFIFGQGQTLTPGAVITVSGTTFSMPASASGSVVVINGVTSTLGQAPITAAPDLTIQGTTYSATVRDGTTEYVLGSGTTLRPGEAVTISGTTYSLTPEGTALVINSQTSTVPSMPASNSASTTKSASDSENTGSTTGSDSENPLGDGDSAGVKDRVNKWVEGAVVGIAIMSFLLV